MTRMQPHRVPEEIWLAASEVTVIGPILQVGADGYGAFDARGTAFRHPSGETAGLEGVFGVTMGVQQAHGVIRPPGNESARPQPCLEKAALSCTLTACTIG